MRLKNQQISLKTLLQTFAHGCTFEERLPFESLIQIFSFLSFEVRTVIRRGKSTNLYFVGFLQLVGVLVLTVVALLGLDGRVDPLLLHLRPRQVEIGVGLLVQVQGSFGCAERFLVLLLRLAQLDE